MGSRDSSPHQQQNINGSVFGQVTQAGGDVCQIQVKIENLFCTNPSQNANILNHNLEKISLWRRPIQFLQVLIFLIKLIIFWMFIWWKVDYKLPIGLVWKLIKSSLTGELTQNIVSLQQQNDSKVNQFIKNTHTFSLEEKIALEAQIKLCFDLIKNLASDTKPEHQEAISDFLIKNRSKLSWFSSQIDESKKAKYRKLYDLQAKESKHRDSQEIIENYIGRILTFLSIQNPSSSIAYELVQETDDFIQKNKNNISIQELATLKSLRKVLSLISRKFTLDPSSDNNSLQERYNNLLDDSENRESAYQAILNEKENLNQDLAALRSDYNDLIHQLKNTNSLYEKLESEYQKLKYDFDYQSDIRSQLIQDKQSLKNHRDRLIESKNMLEQKIIKLEQDQHRMREDPIVYLSDYWKIRYIAKGKSKKYHSDRNCRHWKSCFCDYLKERSLGDRSTEKTIFSSNFETDFLDRELCKDCKPQ